MKKAAKKAKTFETQKLIKRLKDLRKKQPVPPELTDLEEQLVLLKDVDHEAVANTALKTKLKKDKKLSTNEDLQTAIANELPDLVTPAASGSNLAKVQGRLLSSKVLASEVATVVKAIEAVVFPAPKKSRDETAEEEDVNGESDSERPVKKTKTRAALAERSGSSEDEGDSDGGSQRLDHLSDDEGANEDGWESGTVGGGSDADSGEDSSDEESDDDEADGFTRAVKSSASATKADAKKPSSSKTKADPPAKKSAGESTFLPSLAVGYTRGDSDASDVDDEVDAGPKKNRRGQRARRLIWEKKYGQNANHVKTQQAADRNSYDKSRKSFGKPQGSHTSRPQPHAAGAPRPQFSSQPQRPPVRNEEKPLHPSWEAKKKLKEKQNPMIVPSQGKKIVF